MNEQKFKKANDVNRVTFPLMLTLNKLGIVSDNYISTEYYMILFSKVYKE